MQTVNYHRVLKAGMWLAAVVGAYSRLRGLGVWPLAVDEYFVAQSVDNLIQHGVPAFGCGGYYMRGITLQYLIAPLRVSGLSAELAGRLVTVACSFIALPAVYLLGKRLSGVTVACICVVLLSLSLWETEFARFARMYMPFQAVLLWYLLAMHRVVVDREKSAYGWVWLLSVIGALTWEGGLFLLVTNFVPSFMERGLIRARYVAVSAGLLMLGYLYSSLNFRFMGPQPAFPPGLPVQLGGSNFIAPPVLALTLSSYPAWLAAAMALLAVGLVAIVKLARASATVRERTAWSVLIAFSLLNLFGCALLGFVLALLVGWIDLRHITRQCLRIASVPVVASFGFWLAYALFTKASYQLFPGFAPGGELSQLAVVLFKYPNIFDSIIFDWLDAIPKLTIVFGGLIALAVAWAVWARDSRYSISLRLTLAVCVIMACLVGVADTKYLKTRYTFFLLPLFYLISVTVIHTLIVHPIRSRPKRGLVLGLSMLALVGLSEDFGWAHLVHIDRMRWNYRLPLSPVVSSHYYPRDDFLTPAEFVNLRARPVDRIIIAQMPTAYYLKRTDYFYRNFREIEFASVACDAGQRERWTGSRLLYQYQQLFSAVAAAPGKVWLIVRMPRGKPVIKKLQQRFSVAPVYVGFEGEMTVYKIGQSY